MTDVLDYFSHGQIEALLESQNESRRKLNSIDTLSQFVIPDHGTLEDALCLARELSGRYADGLPVLIRSGIYHFQNCVVLNHKIIITGDGRPVLRGRWVIEGSMSRFSGVDFENVGGPCLTVQGGELLLDQCNVLASTDRLATSNEPSVALLCSAGLATLRQCNLGGKTDGQSAKDGIVAYGSGNVLAELSKVSWCEYAVGAADSAQVHFSPQLVHFPSRLVCLSQIDRLWCIHTRPPPPPPRKPCTRARIL
jgi:hypothetical protein